MAGYQIGISQGAQVVHCRHAKDIEAFCAPVLIRANVTLLCGETVLSLQGQQMIPRDLEKP
ncbi:hypothetical protein [uncultured Sulfitobacter sp.]|uniref:hypothetical protein n=1 Tax=uncultured Sulfitobacter sp. TaxID=191468 RepID=UPI002613C065|nr:hypothetical protein [uncultured Sulfitobacter sp.]